MRKLLYSAISLAAAAAFATPALAQPAGYRDYDSAPSYHSRAAAEVGAGVVGGTVAGLGVSEGWWGAAATAALPVTVAGAAAIGGLTGIGVVVLIDAATQPCRGFAAMFNLSEGECVNGQYVGYAPPRRAAGRRHR